MSAPAVVVAGIGADGWAGLSPASKAAILDGEVIIGSARQLALLPAQCGARRVTLPQPLLPALERLIAELADVAVVVLASGDPMFYGIGSTLVRLLGAERVTVLSHPSSVSLAAARLGWTLHDIDVISAVGRPLELLHPALQPGRRVLVLASDVEAPSKIRELLHARGFSASQIVVLTDLGGPDEKIAPVSEPICSELVIVAIDCIADTAASPLLPRTPGLPEQAYAQDGQITKREIRALALAALAPVPGQLLWDVGAGSGSIGIEWMRVHPASRAIAIEPRTDRRALISHNASALGVPGLQIVAGHAPAALAGLGTPDAVFIGGGVTVDGVVAACWDALAPGGRLVANAVTMESEQAVVGWQQRLGGTLTRISVEHAAPLGSFTAWRPALPVVQWSVRKSSVISVDESAESVDEIVSEESL